MNRLLPFLTVVSVLAFSCSSQPKPAAAPPAAASTPAELSSIVVPIRTSLAPLLPILEAQVPREMAKVDGYELDSRQRFGMKYRVLRDPIALNMLGSGVHATVDIHYALEGCSRTKNPVSGQYAMWPCISCGFNEPMRLATIELQSRLDWGGDWTLRSLTTARPVAFPNRCGVTFFNIDITDWKLAPLINEQLRDVAKTIDQNTPKLTSIRPAAQKIWSSLQVPAEIAPGTWLVLEPIDVALTPIHGTGLSVESALVLHARTRVVVGSRPITTARPLPPLRSMQPNGSGIRVPFDLEIPYAESSRLLTQQFGGRTYKTGGGTIAVESISLSPGQNGRLNVKASIDFRGGGLRRYHGLVHLDGLPVLDPSKAGISIPDLSYKLDARRRNPFLRTFDRMAHEEVELRLRSGAVWSIADQITGVRSEIERGITRQLSPGVFLRGRVDSIQPVSIVLGADAISIHIVATGAAEVDVKEFKAQ